LAIIQAVINLGSNLGIPTLAEGVETKQQLEWLRQTGCTEMQGYLFSRPVPASEIAALLSRRRIARRPDQYLLTA
jgi:EAL domain-containing protein (putative c-di-GMP-specific phosphodiesterase class I)